MALARRSGQRFQASIWPGFVDVMTALILVLFFVLSIFMIVQFVLRDTITGQDREIDTLAREVASLADALGLAAAESSRQENLIATLTADLQGAEGRAADFESQVAALIAENRTLEGEVAGTRAALASEQQAADLAEARRRALDALVESLRSEAGERATALAEAASALDEAEAARLAEAAAAEMLRDRLENSEAELTALTLSLEKARAEAEETLTLLAAARTRSEELETASAEALSEAEREAALRATAESLLSEQEEVSTEAQRQVALLNQQTAELRRQLDALQGLLDASRESEASAEVQVESLGQNLNSALARLAVEEQARAELEERERERLEAEAQDLQRYRSEFFGRMREILGEREGVEVVGDRFVFQSEVLFQPGSAVLGPEGRAQVSRVAEVIREIADEIPEEINWILRVDGHTDRIPVSPGSPYENNWELSQARALSVVEYMIEAEGLAPERLAATGFGEYQPIDGGTSPEALARNRRIELKFTER